MAKAQETTSSGPAAIGEGKAPRTERGRRTMRAILDAAAIEFGDNGFHQASISDITRRAGVALGSFYTYFDSKDAVFRALVRDMSDRVREHVAPAILSAADQVSAEQAGLREFITFVRQHKEIYRIIDESEFVDSESFRLHYATTADRITRRLRKAAERGEATSDIREVHGWAIMGMNVFLGLRYGVWSEDETPDDIAQVIARMLRDGILRSPDDPGKAEREC